MSTIKQKLLFLFFATLSWLPDFIHYTFSDLLFFFSHHLFRYRDRVVKTNLKRAFPNKTEQELRHIHRKFYHIFCEYLVENMIICGISKRRIHKKVEYKNIALLNRYFKQHKSVIILSGHLFNWEWFLNMQEVVDHQTAAIYHPLSSPTFDYIMKRARSRFGCQLIPQKQVLRALKNAEENNTPLAINFIADQNPPANTPFWSVFLNQETGFFMGAEKLARRYNLPVVFLHTERIRRGHYRFTVEPLFEHGGETEEFEITRRYAAHLEKKIEEHPSNWLWSHRRWKNRRQQSTPLSTQ